MEIGTVTITYSANGTIINSETYFTPSMQVSVSQENLLNEFMKITEKTDSEILKQNADLVIASWFSKMNEIELDERPGNGISSELIRCEKYSTGQIRKCVIRYNYSKK